MLSLAIFFLILLAFQPLLCVKAGLFVVNPQQGSVCHGGEPCTVTWLDDGAHPLLSEIRLCTVGLYTGKQKLVQAITPVDVSQQPSLTFIPVPAAGPNSDAYYLSFISTSAKQNDSLPYAAFSPFFRLDQMTGSFTTPDPSAILPIPVPTSINTGNSSNSNTVLSTITVGTILPSTARSSSIALNITTTASSSQATAVPSTTSHTPLSSPLTAPTTVTSPAPIQSLALSPSTMAAGSTLTVSPSLPSSVSPSAASSWSLSPLSSSLSPSPSSPGVGSSSGVLGAGLSRCAGMGIASFAGIVGIFLAL